MKMVRFFRAIYRDNKLRQERKRSLSRDILLYSKNRSLRPIEWCLTQRYADATKPLVFIVGAPRSGTTLLYQMLVKHAEFAYVSNFAAKYWMAPLYASIRQARTVAPGGNASSAQFGSTLGSTEGDAAPHEFSYFWQFWTEFGETDHLTDEELGRINWEPIRRELSALAGWAQKSYLAKAITFTNYHIQYLASVWPTSRFIFIQRDLPFVVQSILESRRLRYGSEAVWWSIRPRDVAAWAARSPLDQVLHQVKDCIVGVERGIRSIDPRRVMRVQYEEFCRRPSDMLRQLADFSGTTLKNTDELSTLQLKCGNVQRLDDRTFAGIRQHFAANAMTAQNLL